MFAYSEPVLDRFPTIVGGILHARGVVHGSPQVELRQLFRDEQQRTLERIGDGPLAELPSIAAWRRAFSAFGVEPTRYRSAAEALLRRLTKQGEIPSLNALADLGNLVSIRYGLPVAVFDRRSVTGSTAVRFAEGDESFTDLGGDGSASRPEPGEVIFVDDASRVSARRWCWRQSAESAARADTTEILVTVEGHHDRAAEDVARAVEDLRAARPLRERAGCRRSGAYAGTADLRRTRHELTPSTVPAVRSPLSLASGRASLCSAAH